MSITRLLIALSLTFASARADVVVVDPAGRPGVPLLNHAILDAAPGDVLLLEPGNYQQDFQVILIDRGITLMPASETARITLGPVDIRLMAAGQTAVLHGFDVLNFAGGTQALIIWNLRGTAWIEDCNFVGHAGGTVLTPFTNEPGSICANVFQAHAIFRHCSFAAGAGGAAVSGLDPSSGGDALLVNASSKVALYDCTLVGGECGSGMPTGFTVPGAGRALVTTASDTTLSGCTLTGGKEAADNDAQPGTSGSAIRTDGIVGAVRVLQSSLMAGAVQGAGTQAPAVVDPGSIVTLLAEPARSLVLPALAQAGPPVTLLLDGEPGDVAFVLMSPLGAAMPVPTLEGTLAVQPGTFPAPVTVGVLPGPDGQLSLPLSIGLLPPGVEALTMFAQLLVQDADGRSLGGASAITWFVTRP